MKPVKKVIFITDISLSSGYNAGNKNAFLSLCDFFDKNEDFECEVLNFNHQKPERNLFSTIKVYHYPDFVNLLYRKISTLLKRDIKLMDYKQSVFKTFVIGQFFKKRYDIVFVEYLENHHVLDCFKEIDVVKICDLHDVMTLRKESFIEAGQLSNLENLNIDLQEELALISRFDAVLAIEESEKKYLEGLVESSKIILCKRSPRETHLPNALTPALQPNVKIGFIGSSAEFNVTTITSFINNVWNKYLYNLKYKLVIAGSVCDEVKGANFKIKGDYEILGRLDNVKDFYSAIHIAINPVLSGSGFKTKNAESLSFGVPVITTANGAKGLECIDEKYCSVLNEDDSWLPVLINIEELYKNDSMLKENCSKHFRERFNNKKCFNELRAYLE